MDQHLADDVVWHVGGNSKWAGAYQGKVNVLGVLRPSGPVNGRAAVDQQRPPTGTTSDDRAALGRVRGLQGAPSRLGHVHAYQTISSRRALSMMLKNQ